MQVGPRHLRTCARYPRQTSFQPCLCLVLRATYGGCNVATECVATAIGSKLRYCLKFIIID